MKPNLKRMCDLFVSFFQVCSVRKASSQIKFLGRVQYWICCRCVSPARVEALFIHMETVRVSKSLKEMRETVSSQARQGTLDVWIKKRKRPLPASPSTTKEKEQPRNSTVQEVQLPPTPDEDYLLLVEQIESEHIITNNLAKKKRKVEAQNAPLLLPNAEKEGQGQEKDFWDSSHVRLPSSARNVYMKRGVSTLLSKW